MNAEIERLIASAPAKQQLTLPILIYGAGNKGREVYRFLVDSGYTVDGFLDTNARPGQACEGIAVHAPCDWLEFHQPESHSIIVAIHNYAVDMVPLLADIRAMGFRRVVNIVEFYNLFAGGLPHHYWLAPRSFYAPFLSDIEALSGILADSASRNWLEAVLLFRLSGDYGRLPPPQFGDQYRPADLPRWQEPLRFIDCGAFDGDTLDHLAQGGYTFEAVAAFEPDPANFVRLARKAPDYGIAVCFPCGVSAITSLVRFSAGDGMASRVTQNGDSVIQCVALDEALPNFRPTLIKMDIEGAEIDALNGGRLMIESSRPGLAISLYHHPAHLWQIPLLIASWSLDYRLYIRGHAHNSFELVLYALPD